MRGRVHDLPEPRFQGRGLTHPRMRPSRCPVRPHVPPGSREGSVLRAWVRQQETASGVQRPFPVFEGRRASTCCLSTGPHAGVRVPVTRRRVLTGELRAVLSVALTPGPLCVPQHSGWSPSPGWASERSLVRCPPPHRLPGLFPRCSQKHDVHLTHRNSRPIHTGARPPSLPSMRLLDGGQRGGTLPPPPRPGPAAEGQGASPPARRIPTAADGSPMTLLSFGEDEWPSPRGCVPSGWVPESRYLHLDTETW